MRVKIIKLEKYGMGTYGLNDNIGKVLEARDVGMRDVFEVIFPANEPIRLFVAKEELVVINPNTEIILKYLEENNWKDYFYNSTARLYTYEQLYSIAKHINLKNRSLYIKSGLIEKLNELYFGKEKKEEKKPVPPYTEEDAIKLCQPKGEGFGTAFYSVVYEHKHYTGQNTACHAGLKNAKYYADSTGAGKLVAIADYPEYRCNINGDAKRYADYIVNRSAFAKAFKTKDYDGKALLMNIQECSHNFIVIACIALRASTEFLDMCKSWCYLVDQGIDEHKAYFLSYFFSKAYSDVFVHHPYMSGSHRIFEGGICSIQDFAALVKGEFVDKDKPCAEEFKSYYSVSGYYTRDGNYSLNFKWLYEKLGKVGTINETPWAITYEIKGHKDLLKACKNFDW